MADPVPPADGDRAGDPAPAAEPADEPPRRTTEHGEDEPARPERLIVVARLEQAGEARYVLVRWPDWPHPALLSLAAPAPGRSPAEAVRTLLASRLRLRCEEEPRASPRRLPVRQAHPRMGGEGLGWLRAVAVRAGGEPEPDALLAGVETLPLEEALEALPTEVERTLLREAAALFDEPATP